MKHPTLRALLFLISFAALIPCAKAQWVEQTFKLTNGWTAIYLNIDATHTGLNQLVGTDPGNPIREIYRWVPLGSMQFVDNPLDPLNPSQWTKWVRTNPDSPLQNLVGNTAYLVRIDAATHIWTVKGIPLPPRYEWTATGLNFLGFPTHSSAPPNFEDFISESPALLSEVEITGYKGGVFAENSNPVLITAHRTVKVNRGQAYWLRSANFNDYFGPFKLSGSNPSGIDFGADGGSATVRLQNLTGDPLTVTMNDIGSLPAPGQSVAPPLPPLLLRKAFNPQTLSHEFTNLTSNVPVSWTLAPKGQTGSEVEVVLGLNRTALAGAPGAFYATVLRFSDSLGHLQVEIPVSATKSSNAGLWTGKAMVTQVGQYLKTYERSSAGELVVNENGNYVVTSTNTTMEGVVRPYPLRLIVHNPTNNPGNAVLLQRVYVGINSDTNPVVATKEESIGTGFHRQSSRISSAHLPWSAENTPFAFDGGLGAEQITTRVTTGYGDHSSNPFLHTYHPDHDNIDASYKKLLDQGSESFTIQRHITLTPTAPPNDFSSLVSSHESISGLYEETITLLGLKRGGGNQDTREFKIRGVFTLNRISQIPALTIAP